MATVYIIAYSNGKLTPGRTVKTAEERYKEHESGARNGSYLPKHRAMMKYGIENCEDWPRSKASQMLNYLHGRRQHGLCTFKQSRVLARYGVTVKGIKFAQASKIIDGLATRGWKVSTERVNEIVREVTGV